MHEWINEDGCRASLMTAVIMIQRMEESIEGNGMRQRRVD